MKIMVNGYTVTVTAKKERNRENTRKETMRDTMAFLCDLSLAFFDAANDSDRKKLPYTAEHYRTAAGDLYNALEKVGYFNDIKATA